MSRDRRQNIEVAALLLRRTEYGESDLILSVLADDLGQISVIARSARASRRRFSGGIEPFHGLRLHLDEPQHGELYHLRDAQIEFPRLRLVASLVALEVAGRALGWVRSTTVPRTPEPDVFDTCTSFLNALDRLPPTTTTAAEALLSQFGLALLVALGWALELKCCVRCGRACPENSPCTLEPRQGGLVCRRCGGGRYPLAAELRHRMLAASRGDTSALYPTDAAMVLGIVDAALLAHPGVQTP